MDAGTERRLWIGNLDPRVTEFTLLKIVQKYGAIEKFDLMFHRSGPQAGMPRGYAFVTYINRDHAAKAKQLLDNVLIGQKNVRVMWAHMVNHFQDEVDKPKPEVNIPALAMSKGDKKTDKEIQIQLIEAKLKMMEKKSEDELKINDTVASKTPIIQYNKQPVGNSSCGSSSSTNNGNRMRNGARRQDKYNKPYSKNKTYR